METLIETWNYINTHWDTIWWLTKQHIEIVAVANGIATLIGVTIGIYITRKGKERVADIVLYLASIMITIPSLALFGLLIPLIAWAGLPRYSIGFLPAMIALVLYGQLPIIRNTYTAIKGIEPAMIEAGKGMGMTDRQLLFKVKLPLTVPVIMAGLRTALVMNVAIAAIAAVIGSGGLGLLIWRGVVNWRMDLIITGAIFVSALALIIDGLMALIEKQITPKGLKVQR